jgi:hypothetical protein
VPTPRLRSPTTRGDEQQVHIRLGSAAAPPAAAWPRRVRRFMTASSQARGTSASKAAATRSATRKPFHTSWKYVQVKCHPPDSVGAAPGFPESANIVPPDQACVSLRWLAFCA